MVLMVIGAECDSVEKQSDKKLVYVLTVHWQNGPKTSITRNFFDFFDFTNTLKTVSKKMKGVTIPALPGLRWFQRFGNAAEKRKSQVNDFCKDVIDLTNKHTSQDIETEVTKFFTSWMIDLEVPSQDPPKAEKGKNKGKDKEKEKDKDKEKKEDKKKDKKEEKGKKQGSKKKKPEPEVQTKEDLKELQDSLKQQGTETCTEPDPNNQFIVSVDYLEPEEGQIPLHCGDLVEVMEKTMSGWWFVCFEDGQKEGWAPASILEPLDPYAPNDVQPAAVATSGGIFRAMADYKAMKDDELTYKKDQIIEVVSMSLDGWWTAKIDGKTGLVSAPNLKQVKDIKRDKSDVIPLYETFSLYQQHSIYKKKPPPRRDPSICLSELYAKVDTTHRIARGPKPEPLSPKPNLDPGSPEEDMYPPPEVPKKHIQPRYTEIVFDDEKPGKPRSVIIGSDEQTIYSEIVLDDPPKPKAPQKQQRTKDIDRASQAVSQPGQAVSQPGPCLNFHEAQEDYTPNSIQKDQLGLSKGNVVVIQQERVELVFCELCSKDTDTNDKSRKREGWVPKRVLRPAKCDILREENGVKIVRQVQPIPAQRALKINGHSNPNPPTVPSKNAIKSTVEVNGSSNPQTPEPAPPRPPLMKENRISAAPPHSPSSPLPTGMHPPLGRTASGDSGDGYAKKYLWFAGVMDRTTCSEHMKGAKEGQFLVRESKGEYSLSVASREKIRHFQIKHTDNGQYAIGGFNFKNLKDIIKHYKKQPLYYADSENKDGRCLTEPFIAVGIRESS